MRTILSIIMVIAAVLGIVLYAVPTYQSAQALQAEEKDLDTALTNARKLQSARDELIQKFNSFSSRDIERIETMIPDNIDNVKLIIELDALASVHGLAIQNIDVVEKELSLEEQQMQQSQDYAYVDLNVGLTGPYERFVSFIEDVEKSLRLIDVQAITFQSDDEGRDNYKYDMTVRTYWLK
jgi:Tfp pilus assembly protein PilO